MSIRNGTNGKVFQRELPSYGVPPVERAFKLLRHIAAGDSIANMSLSARALNISRTTLMRLIATLEAEQMIERKADGTGYNLGLGLVGLAGQALYASDLVQVGDPVLASLTMQLGLSSHIGVLDGTDVLYVARRTPNAHLVSNVGIGSRLPAHATTMGRIMLAQLSSNDVERLYQNIPLKRLTEKTPATLQALLAQCSIDRKTGIAWSDSHYEAGIASAAAILRDRFGGVIGALNVTGPTSSFTTHSGRHAEIGNAVCAAAATISSRLGYTSRSGNTINENSHDPRRMQ
jgi:DNA-binding IclR family transcriptional regulator